MGVRVPVGRVRLHKALSTEHLCDILEGFFLAVAADSSEMTSRVRESCLLDRAPGRLVFCEPGGGVVG